MTVRRHGASDSNHLSKASSSSSEMTCGAVKHWKGRDREIAQERSSGFIVNPASFSAYDRSEACSLRNRPTDWPVRFSDAIGRGAFRLRKPPIANMPGNPGWWAAEVESTG